MFGCRTVANVVVAVVGRLCLMSTWLVAGLVSKRRNHELPADSGFADFGWLLAGVWRARLRTHPAADFSMFGRWMVDRYLAGGGLRSLSDCGWRARFRKDHADCWMVVLVLAVGVRGAFVSDRPWR